MASVNGRKGKIYIGDREVSSLDSLTMSRQLTLTERVRDLERDMADVKREVDAIKRRLGRENDSDKTGDLL